MCTILWILYLYGCTVGYVESTRPTNYSRLKIIGGRIIPIRWRPFMVSLHTETEFICGGSVLSSVWILSAQHCIDPHYYAKIYYVRAGSSYYDRGGSIHDVVDFITYSLDSYSFGIPLNDIILLKVAPPLKFSLKILPARLPDSDFVPNWLWVSGWGKTETKPTSNLLRTAKVPYFTYDECMSIVPSYSEVLDQNSHMCFGGIGHDSCYGDSGGPLSSTFVIYGIVSFGNRCGEDPGVYTKVFYFVEWINKILNSDYYN